MQCEEVVNTLAFPGRRLALNESYRYQRITDPKVVFLSHLSIVTVAVLFPWESDLFGVCLAHEIRRDMYVSVSDHLDYASLCSADSY